MANNRFEYFLRYAEFNDSALDIVMTGNPEDSAGWLFKAAKAADRINRMGMRDPNKLVTQGESKQIRLDLIASVNVVYTEASGNAMNKAAMKMAGMKADPTSIGTITVATTAAGPVDAIEIWIPEGKRAEADEWVAGLRAAVAAAGRKGNVVYAAPPTIEGPVKVCPDCAEDVKFAARKCKHCGYVFTDEDNENAAAELAATTPEPAPKAETATTSAASETQTPAVASTPIKEPTQTTSKKSRKGLIIGGIAVVAVAGIIAAVTMASVGSKEEVPVAAPTASTVESPKAELTASSVKTFITSCADKPATAVEPSASQIQAAMAALNVGSAQALLPDVCGLVTAGVEQNGTSTMDQAGLDTFIANMGSSYMSSYGEIPMEYSVGTSTIMPASVNPEIKYTDVTGTDQFGAKIHYVFEGNQLTQVIFVLGG